MRRLVTILDRKGQAIVHGPPGTGKTRLALEAARVVAGLPAAEVPDQLRGPAPSGDGTMPEIVLTSFHPSLGYEDFVEGFKPTPSQGGGLTLARTDGLFLRLCKAATDRPDQRFVLIIDEINRADLGRVFGELVTLLERDKRERVAAALPVSGATFVVPRNIAIIGTMNTADRSVAHIDAAIRRRFGFLELGPDPSILEATIGALNLATLLSELNRRVSALLGPDHRLGHAYLLHDDLPVDSAEALASAFYDDIVPQLEDATIGDRSLLRQIVGPGFLGVDGEVRELEADDLVVTLAKEFDAGETPDA